MLEFNPQRVLERESSDDNNTLSRITSTSLTKLKLLLSEKLNGKITCEQFQKPNTSEASKEKTQKPKQKFEGYVCGLAVTSSLKRDCHKLTDSENEIVKSNQYQNTEKLNGKKTCEQFQKSNTPEASKEEMQEPKQIFPGYVCGLAVTSSLKRECHKLTVSKNEIDKSNEFQNTEKLNGKKTCEQFQKPNTPEASKEETQEPIQIFPGYVCGLAVTSSLMRDCHKLTVSKNEIDKSNECQNTEKLNGKKTCEQFQKPNTPEASKEEAQEPIQIFPGYACGLAVTSSLTRDCHKLTDSENEIDKSNQHQTILPKLGTFCASARQKTSSISTKTRKSFGQNIISFPRRKKNGHGTAGQLDVQKPRKARKGHKCKKCKCYFETPTALIRHAREHFGEHSEKIKPSNACKPKNKKEWKCDTCDSIFEKKYELKRHTLIHKKMKKSQSQNTTENRSKTKPRKCTECLVTFDNKSEFKCHISEDSHEPVKNKVKCADCEDSFINTCALAIHRKKLHGKWECSKCDTTLNSQPQLNKHFRQNHVVKSVFACDNCNAVYVKSASLIRHHKQTHLIGDFHCKYCDQIFSTGATLTEHIRTHRPFVCKECPASYTQRAHLDTHSLAHSNKRFECQECGARFIRNDYLKFHLRSHTFERSYKCDHCDRSFSRKTHLRTHVLTHSLERPFKCNQCTASFNQKAALTLHVQTHNGEKAFICNECNVAFARKGDLQRHMDLHIGKKQFKCSECQYACARKGNLNVHMRVHTGERPYKCIVCNRGCTNKSDLTKHVKLMHSVVELDTDDA